MGDWWWRLEFEGRVGNFGNFGNLRGEIPRGGKERAGCLNGLKV
jgi:hypothetical protein